MNQVDSLIERAQDLEPLPNSVTRLATLVASNETSIGEIAEVVSFDPGLTAKLLRFSNSVAAGRGEITTVQMAVSRLGVGCVLQVAAATSVMRRFSASIPEYGIPEGGFWRHSVTAALAAESMATLAETKLPPEAFTAALLHDVGKLVLRRFLDAEVRAALVEAQKADDPQRAESEVLGIHHAELGGLVCENWGLPESICRGVTHHHAPDDGKSLVCDVVHVANVVAHAVEDVDETPEVDPMAAANARSLERLQLPADRVEELRVLVQDLRDDVLDRYGASSQS